MESLINLTNYLDNMVIEINKSFKNKLNILYDRHIKYDNIIKKIDSIFQKYKILYTIDDYNNLILKIFDAYQIFLRDNTKMDHQISIRKSSWLTYDLFLMFNNDINDDIFNNSYIIFHDATIDFQYIFDLFLQK